MNLNFTTNIDFSIINFEGETLPLHIDGAVINDNYAVDMMNVCIEAATSANATTIVCPILYTFGGHGQRIDSDDAYRSKVHHITDMLFVDQSYIDNQEELDHAEEMANQQDYINMDTLSNNKEEAINMTNTTNNATTEDTTIEGATTTPSTDATAKAKMFDMFDSWVSSATTTVNEHLSKSELATLVSTNDADVYDQLNDYLTSIAMKMMAKKKTAKEGAKIMDETADIEDMVEVAVTKGISLAKIKEFIAMCFKTAISVIKGVAMFSGSVICILSLATLRIGYATTRELVLAGKAIKASFIKNVVASVK